MAGILEEGEAPSANTNMMVNIGRDRWPSNHALTWGHANLAQHERTKPLTTPKFML
jgi:hypothetical protein